MELPHIGIRCHDPECNQLDFLPIKCDACKNSFCENHYKYALHGCKDAEKKNKVVPTCAQCQSLVPAGNLSEDEAMKLHLSKNCTPYKKTKIYTNRCNKDNCKRKELIQINCEKCQLVYCIKHRHASDHECRGNSAARHLCATAAEKRLRELSLESASTATEAAAAAHRLPSSSSPTTCSAQQRSAADATRRTLGEFVRSTNANLSEKEALALAIAESEAEAKKREDENRKRLIDAAAS